MHNAPIVGINPKTGKRIKFESISRAAMQLGFSYQSVYKAVKGDRKQLYGWEFKYYDKKMPIDEAPTESAPVVAVPKVRKLARYVPQRLVEDAHREEDFAGHNCIGVGYFLPDFTPYICPGCKKVITGTSESKVRAHMISCIAGRPYSVNHGIIKIWD